MKTATMKQTSKTAKKTTARLVKGDRVLVMANLFDDLGAGEVQVARRGDYGVLLTDVGTGGGLPMVAIERTGYAVGAFPGEFVRSIFG